MDEKESDDKIIIEGVTASGEPFRPSNWVERVSGKLATYRKHRIAYSPLLKPSTHNGNRCVVLDPKLKESNPKLYQSILDFAENNELNICKDTNETSNKKNQDE